MIPKTILRNQQPVNEIPSMYLRSQPPAKEASTQFNKKIKKEGKVGEEIVGKYIIGALASILIFVAAVSLIALVWGRMSSEFKLLLLGIVSVTLIAIGFIRIKKHNKSITSLLLGKKEDNLIMLKILVSLLI